MVGLRSDSRRDLSLTCFCVIARIPRHPELRLLVGVASCELTQGADGNSVHQARWLLAAVFAVSITFLANGR
ncbi:MAG: hypothetical protein EOQ99_16075 [Mesorhizobium sp.]|nr:MAG: hypothetical protein EOQ56_02575 [Mesorhizobium sp.]RWP04994.1 MAG: hypothetical protein EOQ99_16075 [Mesorhizobium sp.]RWQ16345.1 MAG: hypothetical protein EOR92_21935 [Mesorhizobium sp.]